MTYLRLTLTAIIFTIAFSSFSIPATAQDGPPAGCIYAEKDSSFETDAAWEFTETAVTGFFDTKIVHTGKQSAFIGISSQTNNQEVDTTIWQEIQLPSAENITLTAWLYTNSGDKNDNKYIIIWDLDNSESVMLLNEPMTKQDWHEYTVDLTPFAGKNILLVFGVHNDGAGEKAGMWIDDVHVTACGGDTSIPPTPTPTPTKTPSISGQPEPLESPTGTPSPSLDTSPTPKTVVTPPTPTTTPTATMADMPALPTPQAPQYATKGLPDNNILPLLAGIVFSSLIVIIAVAIKMRR